MIKRKYFFEVQLKPHLREQAIENGEFSMVTGLVYLISFFPRSTYMYGRIIEMVCDMKEWDFEADDLIITSFNRV